MTIPTFSRGQHFFNSSMLAGMAVVTLLGPEVPDVQSVIVGLPLLVLALVSAWRFGIKREAKAVPVIERECVRGFLKQNVTTFLS